MTPAEKTARKLNKQITSLQKEIEKAHQLTVELNSLTSEPATMINELDLHIKRMYTESNQTFSVLHVHTIPALQKKEK